MPQTYKAIRTIGVLGAGAFGTALADACARKNMAVTLWGRDADVVDQINDQHRNDQYLPNHDLSPHIVATTILDNALHQDLVLVAIPTQFMADVLTPVAATITAQTPVVICAKGIEITTQRLVSQILGGIAPQAAIGVLSGPSFAAEVARDLPTALTLAMPEQHAGLAYHVAEALSQPHLRLYTSTDMVGIQIGGAVKNVIAIACGIAHGKQMGDNARAALLTRGLAEIVRLGVAMGASPETFLGLSGLGDLTLTCSALQSRNFSLGVAIGQGARAADILAERRSIAEGYYTAEAVVRLARDLGVDMPITAAVFDALHQDKAIDHVIRHLLGRPLSGQESRV